MFLLLSVCNSFEFLFLVQGVCCGHCGMYSAQVGRERLTDSYRLLREGREHVSLLSLGPREAGTLGSMQSGSGSQVEILHLSRLSNLGPVSSKGCSPRALETTVVLW